MPSTDAINPRRTLILGLTFLAIIVFFASVGKIFENVGADEVVCIQSPVSGKLNWYTSPGVKWQGFGFVTKYKKRAQFWFSEKEDQGSKEDDAIKIRFNDGGHGTISGSVAWEMPIDTEHLNLLHTRYGSQEAIEQQLVRTIVEKSVYMTGPLMSSAESYAERRNDLIRFIEDQIANGIYQTRTEEVKEADPITGEMKTVTHVRLVTGNNGVFSRQDESPLTQFGIKTYNLSLNSITYDDTVEKQIQQQQAAKMQVQTAIANAKKAEQDAITAQKNGEAEAAKAKWDQEVIKAKMVTEAQQKLEVSRLDAQSAAQEKQANILRGEGEAERRKLVMQADGALDPKLAAWKEVNLAYATAIKEYKGNWVPTVVMGNESGKSTGASDLIDMLKVKTAKDIALEMELSGKDKTK